MNVLLLVVAVGSGSIAQVGGGRASLEIEAWAQTPKGRVALGRNAKLHTGDSVWFEAVASERVYLYVLGESGERLVPLLGGSGVVLEPGRRARIPAAKSGRRRGLTLSPPSGRERLVLVASRVPISVEELAKWPTQGSMHRARREGRLSTAFREYPRTRDWAVESEGHIKVVLDEAGRGRVEIGIQHVPR